MIDRLHREALKAAQLSQDVYRDIWWKRLYSIDPLDLSKQFDEWELRTEGTSRYYLGKKGKTARIIISGSDGDDWLGPTGNLNLLITPAQKLTNKIATDASVHPGFLLTWKTEIKKAAIKYVRNSGCNKIVIGGHSKGGAVAKIGAENLAYYFPGKKISCYTMSAPSCGNKAFYDIMTDRGIRLLQTYTEGDIIPSLPPKWLGYYHAPDRITISVNRRRFPLPIKLLWPIIAHAPIYQVHSIQRINNRMKTRDKNE